MLTIYRIKNKGVNVLYNVKYFKYPAGWQVRIYDSLVGFHDKPDFFGLIMRFLSPLSGMNLRKTMFMNASGMKIPGLILLP